MRQGHRYDLSQTARCLVAVGCYVFNSHLSCAMPLNRIEKHVDTVLHCACEAEITDSSIAEGKIPELKHVGV